MPKLKSKKNKLKTTNKITDLTTESPVNKQPPTLQDIYERELVSKRHNCTDVICLLIFIVFGIVQAVLSVFIFVKGGDPANVILPHDSTGQLCSGSSPNLFYLNLASCLSVNALVGSCSTPTICVQKCPDQYLFYLIDSQRNILFNNFCVRSQLKTYFSPNPVPSTIDSNSYLDLISKQICPSYALTSSAFYSRCLPNIITSTAYAANDILISQDPFTNKTFNITDPIVGSSITGSMITQAAKYVTDLLNIKTTAQFILEDFINSSVLIAILLLIAAVTSFIFIVIMRWVIGPFIYGTLICLVGLLVFGTYYCISKYITLKNANSTSSSLSINNTTQSISQFSFSTEINNYLSLSVTWLVFGIIAGCVLLIVLLLILVLIKRLRLAIQLVREGSKAITGVFLTVLFPIFPLIFEMAFLAYFIATAVYLACAGSSIYRVVNTTNSTNSSISVSLTCDPKHFSVSNASAGLQCLFYRYGVEADSLIDSTLQFLNNYQWLPQIYNLFMLFWTEAFLMGLNQMILAGCFGIWYWSKSKSHCILFVSIKDTFIYHLGSIAFGALLIAIVKTIRFIIQFVEKRVKSAAGNNRVSKCIISFVSCCCQCCFYCMEKFLKYVNRNAYIMTAIYGRNFCTSAVDALSLLASNPLRSLVLDRVTDFVLFIGRLLITAGVGVLGFYFFSKSFYIDPAYKAWFQPDLHYYWLPLIAVIIGAYFIAKTFLTVFEMAVDTVFLCALKDLSIHDGSAEKPYFMSTKLRKILAGSNKSVPDN